MKPQSTGKSHHAFTLVEIMVVLLIAAILTALATAMIDRIKDKAARSLVQNNLRQLYQAKEYYFSATGQTEDVNITTLVSKGYVSEVLSQKLYSTGSMETKAGWQYASTFSAGQPTYASLASTVQNQGISDEVIYYPNISTNIEPPPDNTGDGSPSNSSATPANPATTSNNNQSNQGQGNGNNSGKPNQTGSPGNSDFGHSHNPK